MTASFCRPAKDHYGRECVVDQAGIELPALRCGRAGALGLEIHVILAAGESDFEPAFAALSSHRAGALLVANDPFLIALRERLVRATAERGRWKAIRCHVGQIERTGKVKFTPPCCAACENGL
jgi:hypothetical protein